MSYDVRYKGILVARMTTEIGDACIKQAVGEWQMYRVEGATDTPCFVVYEAFQFSSIGGEIVVFLWDGTKIIKKSD